MLKRSLLFLLAASLFFVACDDSDNDQPRDVRFQLELRKNGNAVALRDTVDLSNGYTFTLTKFLLYLSRVELTDVNGDPQELKKIALLRLEEGGNPFFTGKLKPGLYTDISLGLGVDSVQNESDPTSFSQDHPLAAYQQTYWTMLKYRFAIIEGRSNDSGSLGSSNDILNAYHPGTNPLYQTVEEDFSFRVPGESNVPQLRLVLDIDSLFDGPHRIDFRTQPQTHSDTATIEIARDLMENMAAGARIEKVGA